jgi:NADPH:quinone reductase-like Zn-dependent oxidoreductase
LKGILGLALDCWAIPYSSEKPEDVTELNHVLRLKEVSKPVPENDEVRVKIYATAVTASDCIVRGFKVPLKFWILMALAVGFIKPKKPN